MFLSALFIIAKRSEQLRYPSETDKLGTSMQHSIVQQEKEMCYQAMKRPGGTLTPY